MTEVEELREELKKAKEELEVAHREIDQLKAKLGQEKTSDSPQTPRWVGVRTITISTF
ncbi:MAG: hypothetical protein HYV41_01345 [Candidatus Magasanikbacteria bacterium]|nr:hypothetical protein [Candidatus Magasanikbacteria bacterium]